ncbi:hypothetical protein GCM10017710_22230 [Arthrobacter ramosus]
MNGGLRDDHGLGRRRNVTPDVARLDHVTTVRQRETEGPGSIAECRAPDSFPVQGDNRGPWDGARRTLLTDTFDGTHRGCQDNTGDNPAVFGVRTAWTGASAQPQDRGQQDHDESLHFTHQHVSIQGAG